MPIKTRSSAIVSADRTWTQSADLTHDFPGDGSAVQTAEMRLKATLSLYSYRVDATSPAQKFLLVSLEGSTVSPSASGTILWDGDERRGWFTTGVDVLMKWADSPAHELTVPSDSPGSDEVQASDSTSTSIDYNVNAGFFGADPTAGASFGGSISNSWSENLTDFAIDNTTSEQGGIPLVRHTLRLATVIGHSYGKPEDLVNAPADAGTFLKGAAELGRLIFAPKTKPIQVSLFSLPDKAKSDLALISQALFQSPLPLSAQRTLNITVTHHVESVSEGSALFFGHREDSWVGELDCLVDFGLVK